MTCVPALPGLPEPCGWGGGRGERGWGGGSSQGVVSGVGQHPVESGLRGLQKQFRED